MFEGHIFMHFSLKSDNIRKKPTKFMASSYTKPLRMKKTHTKNSPLIKTNFETLLNTIGFHSQSSVLQEFGS